MVSKLLHLSIEVELRTSRRWTLFYRVTRTPCWHSPLTYDFRVTSPAKSCTTNLTKFDRKTSTVCGKPRNLLPPWFTTCEQRNELLKRILWENWKENENDWSLCSQSAVSLQVHGEYNRSFVGFLCRKLLPRGCYLLWNPQTPSNSYIFVPFQ